MPQILLRRSNKTPPPVFTDEGLDRVQLAFLRVDENDVVALQQRNYVQRQDVPWNPRPSLDEGVDTTRLAYFEKVEERWHQRGQGQPFQQAQPWQAVNFPEQEGVDTTQLAFFYRDENDQWPQNVGPREVVPWAAVWLTDEEVLPVTAAVTIVDEDSFAPPAVVPAARPAPAATDDETSSFLYVEEEYWTSPPVERVPTSLFVQLDESELAGFAYFYPDQEEPARAPVTTTPWAARPFADDEAASISFDLEEPWVPLVTAGPWKAAQFLDDELYALAFLDQEDLPPAPRQAVPWAPFLITDEHALWPLTYFFLIDDDWSAPARTAQPRPWPALADDDLISIAPTNLYDDEAATPTPVTRAEWRTPLLTLDEHAAWPLQNYFDDDAGPVVPAQARPWAAVVLLDDEARAPVLEPEDGPPLGRVRLADCQRAAPVDEERAPVVAEEDSPALALLLQPWPVRRAPLAAADDDVRPAPPAPIFVDDEAGPWSTNAFARTVVPWLRFVVEDEGVLVFLGAGNTGVVLGPAERSQVVRQGLRAVRIGPGMN